MAANSAQHKAPVIVSTPAIAQAANNQPGVPTSAEDFAETMKMPDPTIDPITIMVASSRLSPRTKCAFVSFEETVSSGIAGLRAGSNFAGVVFVMPASGAGSVSLN
jgi:hypothetical protein